MTRKKPETGSFATREQFVEACKRKLNRTSKSMRQIAEELGVDVSAVCNISRRTDVTRPTRKRRTVSGVTVDQVIEYQRRHPLAEMQAVRDKLGCSTNLVVKARRAMNYDYKTHHRRYMRLKRKRLLYYVRKEMVNGELPKKCQAIAARLTSWGWFKYQSHDVRDVRAILTRKQHDPIGDYTFDPLLTNKWTPDGLSCLRS